MHNTQTDLAIHTHSRYVQQITSNRIIQIINQQKTLHSIKKTLKEKRNVYLSSLTSTCSATPPLGNLSLLWNWNSEPLLSFLALNSGGKNCVFLLLESLFILRFLQIDPDPPICTASPTSNLSLSIRFQIPVLRTCRACEISEKPNGFWFSISGFWFLVS